MSETPTLLTPERLEEIRATLVKRLASAREQAKKDGTLSYQIVVSMADGDDLVTALAHYSTSTSIDSMIVTSAPSSP